MTVIPIDDLQNSLFSNLVEALVNKKLTGESSTAIENEIEGYLAKIYLLSDEEKDLINSRM